MSWSDPHSHFLSLPLPHRLLSGQGPPRPRARVPGSSFRLRMGPGERAGRWGFLQQASGLLGLGVAMWSERGGGAAGGAHLWKTTASTVMAASRRKAKAPRMDPITKESCSGSWVDSSPEEPAQDHRWARPRMSTHLHTSPCTRLPTNPVTPARRRVVSSQPLVWRVLGEGSRPGGPRASPHHPLVSALRPGLRSP